MKPITRTRPALRRTALALALTGSLLAVGCATPPHGGPSPGHGVDTAARGVAHLMLSPLMIVAGLAEGLAALPYFLGGGVHEINAGLRDAQAQVDLETTYRHAYDRDLASVPPDGHTGRLFRDMDQATTHFRRVLEGYGVEEADRYLLTAVRSADRDGYTLYAVVYRADGASPAAGPRDRAVYRPAARDPAGRPQDTVVDWAGVPRTAIRTQKGQAILMTLAANSVLINRRSDDYWAAERRWLDGGYRDVVAERQRVLDARMGAAG